MTLIKYEFKKIITSPVMKIVLPLFFLLNIYSLVFGEHYESYSASQSPLNADIQQSQENGAYFKGVIDDEWCSKYALEVQVFRDNPEHHVSEIEKEAIRQNYRDKGYTEEAIAKMSNFIYIIPSIFKSNAYNRYEPIESLAIPYYDNAKKVGDEFAEKYLNQYPDEKGMVLAEKTQELYGTLINDDTVQYNYNMGFQKLRDMHTTYPLSIGIIILIALSPLFATEYSSKTDSLILPTKHGKRKLVYSKIIVGLLFSVSIWAGIQLTNVLIIYGFYGYIGGESFWQNWLLDYAPFLFNQLEITVVTVLTSLLGVLFLASAVMMISAISKNGFISLLLGGMLLLVPLLQFSFTYNNTVQTLYSFLPTRLLSAINIWQPFGLVYLFGQAIPIQYIIIFSAIICIIVLNVLSFCRFKSHQVEN